MGVRKSIFVLKSSREETYTRQPDEISIGLGLGPGGELGIGLEVMPDLAAIMDLEPPPGQVGGGRVLLGRLLAQAHP